MKIIISPYSKPLRNGAPNPKNYPFWQETATSLRKYGHYIIQVGVQGEKQIDGVDEVLFNRPLKELASLLQECGIFISVDNFFQHLAYLHKVPGIVLFGQSDPEIFGHKENINLLKDRKYLRPLQFDIWERCQYLEEAFVEPAVIIDRISKGV
jgi:ADP-heptose:LPS heptosyltransferase